MISNDMDAQDSFCPGLSWVWVFEFRVLSRSFSVGVHETKRFIKGLPYRGIGQRAKNTFEL
eukprot:scaffold1187_cov258-Pinguiococcus_pyrenoidosus.AAC.11